MFTLVLQSGLKFGPQISPTKNRPLGAWNLTPKLPGSSIDLYKWLVYAAAKMTRCQFGYAHKFGTLPFTSISMSQPKNVCQTNHSETLWRCDGLKKISCEIMFIQHQAWPQRKRAKENGQMPPICWALSQWQNRPLPLVHHCGIIWKWRVYRYQERCASRWKRQWRNQNVKILSQFFGEMIERCLY